MQSSLSLRRFRVNRWGLAVALVGLLAVAFWVRWQYVRQVSLDVDEFTTLWAARRILEVGIPSMPSGVIYTRGLLNMYITALFGAIGGLTYTVGRLPSVFFGLLTIATVFWLGRRAWDWRVGWLAALALALIPETIKWDSSARFYAQLVFFALLTLWRAFTLAKMDERAQQEPQTVWRAHLLFALCFVLSLFSQEETILLYPALLVGLWWWRGWRYFLQPATIIAHLICVAGMGARYLFEIFGQPGYFTAVQTHKSYIDPAISWYAIDQLFLPLLPQLWLLFLPLALLITLMQLYKVQWRPRSLPRFHQATLFFLLHFLIVASFLILVVGVNWHDKRFGLMIQPWWLLAGAAGATWLLDKVTTHWSWRTITTALLSFLIVWPLWPMTQRLVARPGEGYDAVFAYVATQRQADDVVMTPQPPVCVFILGQPCDYYARERGYEPYTIARNGVLVDRWSGAQLLETATELEAVVRQAPRTWFVTDRERLATRYNAEFLRLIVEQFEVAFEEREVLALLANGWHEPPRYTEQRTPNRSVQIGPLQLVNWERTKPAAGEPLHTMLFWQVTDVLDEPIHTSLQLVRADGARLSQADGALADGLVATDDQPRTPLPDYKVISLPTDLASGHYRLEVVAYKVATHEPLADPIAVDWFTIGPLTAVPTQSSAVEWQNGLRLLGHDELPNHLLPATSFTIRLVWSTAAPIPEDYTAFVHLIGATGTIIAQHDRRPLDGFYPTSGWVVDKPVADFYSLTLPTPLPPDEYRLVVGWYQPATNERLRLPDGGDTHELTRWVVQP